MRKEILAILGSSDILLDASAIEKIMSAPEPLSFAMAIKSKYSETYLTGSAIESELITWSGAHVIGQEALPASKEDIGTHDLPASPQKTESQSSADELVILVNHRDVSCKGIKPEDYAKLFLSRYKQIINTCPQTVRGIARIKSVKRAGGNDLKIFGIVTEVGQTRLGDKAKVVIEDDSGESITVFVNDKKAKFFLLDEIVGFKGDVSTQKGSSCMFASEVLHPGIPVANKRSRAGHPISVVFISDIHVGSKTFLRDAWNRFIAWLNSDTNETRRVKYILISGDLVDGIGIYPGQEEELEIDDIYEQYSELSRMLSKIPEHIKIIAIPGNHDAVRQAEPQPPLPEYITKLFGDNFICLSNPAYLKIDGVKILMYHGRSFDDLVAQAPHCLSYSKPENLMKELLIRRHLAPTYGDKTPIVPYEHDPLVISDVPDIMVSGHVHTSGCTEVCDVLLVNASTWQSQTEFQKQTNIVPRPAQVLYYELDTGKKIMKDFLK